MRHISEYEPQHDECLIVGNGLSAEHFNVGPFREFCDIWSCNEALDYADLWVYYDKNMQEYFRDFDKGHGGLCGYRYKKIDHTSPNCDYYYGHDDIVFGDTGFHSLQFADKMGYKKIYLIGIDYTCDLDRYHYKDRVSDADNLFRFLKASILTAQRYHLYNYFTHCIINLSNKSQLLRFVTKTAKEVLNERRTSGGRK